MRTNNHKKRLILALLLLAAVLLSSCGNGAAGNGQNQIAPDPSEDISYIRQKGTLIIGVTDYAPLNYKEGDSWVGFDTEAATFFAERLGVGIEFKQIDWDKKVERLESGEIDLIWNGMTKTDDLENRVTCSNPYLSNAQIIVMRREDIPRFTSAETCANLLFSCEEGSTGEAILDERNYRHNEFDSQRAALEAVSEKKTDLAIVDMVMAASLTGSGTDFPNLGFDFPLNDEVFCVGMRKGSDLKEEINVFLSEIFADGIIYQIADRYGLRDALISSNDF